MAQRAGLSVEEQGTSGGFKFEEGNGRIVAASVVIEPIQGYDSKCGLKVGIQRLGKDWKPTSDEPVEEVLGCGGTANFHPGNMAGPADDNPKDLGGDDETEGNCIVSVEGKRVDKKSKSAIFCSSLQEHGVKAGLLNGYAPNLIGLEAHFTQLMLPKGVDYTGKRDPTCLIIGKGGLVNGAETKELIHKYPGAQTGQKGVGAATGKTTPVVNGPPAPEMAVAPTTPLSDGAEAVSEAQEAALAVLTAIGAKGPGQTLPKQKFITRFRTYLAMEKVPRPLHKPAEALVMGEWFGEVADALGWTVGQDGTVTLPAA
jgi:hypothetical protein